MGETQWEDDAGKRGQVDTTFSAEVDASFLQSRLIYFFEPRLICYFFAAQVDALLVYKLG